MSVPAESHRDPVMVTRTTLPPLEDYVDFLRQIWSNHRLTNNGPMVRQLEAALSAHLGVNSLRLVNNCMSALLIALEAGRVTDEVITTPFSYVATSAAIVWQKCTPVFADIRESDLTIDPNAVEKLISSRTRAILATHVYGLPCDVARLDEIAKRHRLLLIYDAAHAFGCSYQGRSLASYGDISCLSFHATKVFHTVEGGAVVVNRLGEDLVQRVEHMRSFGHIGDDYRMPGINAKCSELHAAMGICNLPYVAETIAQRRQVCSSYLRALSGSAVRKINFDIPGLVHNGAYFPVLFPDEPALLRAIAALRAHEIHPRRYFWPALNRLPYLRQDGCPRAAEAASTVLCLPVSKDVTIEIVELVAHCVNSALAK